MPSLLVVSDLPCVELMMNIALIAPSDHSCAVVGTYVAKENPATP